MKTTVWKIELKRPKERKWFIAFPRHPKKNSLQIMKAARKTWPETKFRLVRVETTETVEKV